MLASSKLFALATLVSAALALPSSGPTLRSIPKNAARMAHDLERDVLIAFDARGELLGTIDAKRAFPAKKRDAGMCNNLSPSDAQNCTSSSKALSVKFLIDLLPLAVNGWSQISQYASDNWGSECVVC